MDGVIVNRVLPAEVKDAFFEEWRASQAKILEEIEAYFAPVPVKRVPLFTHEVLGRERLEELARALYAEKEDPAAVTRTEAPYTFSKRDGYYEVRAATAVRGQRRSGPVQEGRRTGGGDRHAAAAHRPADLDGRAFAQPRPIGK